MTWRVLSVSMYDGDLARLDLLVRALKRAGYTSMSRSKVIRIAVDALDVHRHFPQLEVQHLISATKGTRK